MRGPARTMDPPRPYLWYLLQVIQTHFSIFIHFGGKYYINITTQSCFASEESRYRALIWYWDHLKNFIAEIPQGPLGMSIGTNWVTQKWSQGPPARGF